MTTLKKLNISICFFHLRETLFESIDHSSDEGAVIWENLFKLSEKLPFPELQETALKARLKCYDESKKHKSKALNLSNYWLTSDEKRIELTPINIEGWEITGNLQPFLLHDTYAFELALYSQDENETTDINKLSKLPVKDLFLPNESVNTLGQTLWFYGQADVPESECYNVANELVTKFLEKTEYKYELIKSSDKPPLLLEVPLFQYKITDEKHPEKSNQILVWIDHQSIDPDIGLNYFNLLGLLWTYHKIEYGYQAGRTSYEKAREIYSQLEGKIAEFKTNKGIDNLQKILESMPNLGMEYQRQLRNLQAHYTMIKTNKTNYEKYLKEVSKPDEIPVLFEFGETTAQRYLDQIQTYLDYIQPGKDLINEFINTIRGLVEIEQAKIDRSLEKTLQIIGAGLGGGGIAASSLSGYIKEPVIFKSGENISIHPGILAFSLSILIAVLSGLIIAIINGKLQEWLLSAKSGKHIPPITVTPDVTDC